MNNRYAPLTAESLIDRKQSLLIFMLCGAVGFRAAASVFSFKIL